MRRVIFLFSAWLFPVCLSVCAAIACWRQLWRLLHCHPPPSGCPAPSRLVVLLPAYNVCASIERTLTSCLADPHVALVVIADGGSNDGTVALTRAIAANDARVHIIKAGLTGRANCLNLAAAIAFGLGDSAGDRGSTDDDYDTDEAALLFLHSDTTVPTGFGAAIVAALRDEEVALGAFSIYTSGLRDGTHGLAGRAFSRIANTLNNWRSACMETPYGDQAFFCRRSMFEAVGGFPPLPLMEDSGFAWAARRRGTVHILPLCVRTAAGQWSSLSFLFITRNYLMLTAWVIGLVSPEWLHAWYYPDRPVPLPETYSALLRPRWAARGTTDDAGGSAWPG